MDYLCLASLANTTVGVLLCSLEAALFTGEQAAQRATSDPVILFLFLLIQIIIIIIDFFILIQKVARAALLLGFLSEFECLDR
jgi:hypothetical protein